MKYKLPHKIKQFFFVLIKLGIVVAAFYFIYIKLTNNNQLNFSVFTNFLSRNNAFSIENVFFLSILSIFNWFFEILKWKTLISPIQQISFNHAVEQSLGALTASLFTPNRIGEYGVKAIYFLPHNRKHIVLVNILSNSLQMTITSVLGVIGFSFLISQYDVNINYYKIIKILIISLASILLISFVFYKTKFTIKGFSLEKIKHFIIDYPKNKLASGALFSFFRYAIFSFQFYFLLYIFKIDITYLNAMILITSMYLITSLIPSIFIFDVIVKGGVAVYLFSLVGINELTVLCVIMLMWILNFVIPSILGSYYVLNFKLPK
ncbi:hypothetical protein A8C32_14870 [Flavivirga aquatica]|uniref:Lysylphosphatidylglycerol synthetase n=1 Tax=Flavivirga aquatica TaxID=1849968 RepID=A0A1E5T8S4_9FLAO|nr:lysylphosphatidylglycerol synthase domain-containing protein [Flavivirga aquatica]OEK07771.1 hypothetical protein A8C32_14870 [Flavivirga aquatica]